MGSILVRGLDQKTIERLKERARLNGRSLQQEVKALLERAADTLTMREARRVSERWKRRLDGRSFSDSAQLIREDRDSRWVFLTTHHDLRHHGATMALNAGFTGEMVMALGGWKSGQMMRRYAAVTDQTLRAAAEAVSGHEPIPTRKRGGNRRGQPPGKSSR
jgi:plasmid stability protein